MTRSTFWPIPVGLAVLRGGAASPSLFVRKIPYVIEGGDAGRDQCSIGDLGFATSSLRGEVVIEHQLGGDDVGAGSGTTRSLRLQPKST